MEQEGHVSPTPISQIPQVDAKDIVTFSGNETKADGASGRGEKGKGENELPNITGESGSVVPMEGLEEDNAAVGRPTPCSRRQPSTISIQQLRVGGEGSRENLPFIKVSSDIQQTWKTDGVVPMEGLENVDAATEQPAPCSGTQPYTVTIQQLKVTDNQGKDKLPPITVSSVLQERALRPDSM